jgi:hypothetical protein
MARSFSKKALFSRPLMSVNVEETVDDNTQRHAFVGIEPSGALRADTLAQLTAETETICSLMSMESEDLAGVFHRRPLGTFRPGARRPAPYALCGAGRRQAGLRRILRGARFAPRRRPERAVARHDALRCGRGGAVDDRAQRRSRRRAAAASRCRYASCATRSSTTEAIRAPICCER